MNGTSQTNADVIFVHAASSLSSSLEEIREKFEKTKSNNIIFNFASSSVLAKQIEYGLKSDLYISANKKWIDYLITKNKLDPLTIKKLIANQLVLARSLYVKEQDLKHFSVVEHNNSNHSILEERNFVKNMDVIKKLQQLIIVADTAHVPLGEYTKQALSKIGLFSELKAQLIPTSNARSALAFIEQGQASFAILYRSDAKNSNKTKIVQIIPQTYHEPIIYYLVKSRKAVDQVKTSLDVDEVYNFLLSDDAQSIFQKQGFSMLNRDIPHNKEVKK